jgi:hypothetical protein
VNKDVRILGYISKPEGFLEQKVWETLALDNILLFLFFFAFWTVHFLEVNKKPTDALMLQCIATRHSPTCFGTLKCHHQGVNHDPAKIGAQCRRNQRWMGAVYIIAGDVMAIWQSSHLSSVNTLKH